jgi:hypothetical protein
MEHLSKAIYAAVVHLHFYQPYALAYPGAVVIKLVDAIVADCTV